MRSGNNNFNYFPKNRPIKLAHLVQFKRVLMSCLRIGGGAGIPGLPWLRRCVVFVVFLVVVLLLQPLLLHPCRFNAVGSNERSVFVVFADVDIAIAFHTDCVIRAGISIYNRYGAQAATAWRFDWNIAAVNAP